MGKQIDLRPHHGLCIRYYTGHGYDDRFTENMNQVVNMLKSNPQQEITLYMGADALCKCCPNLHGGVCESEEKVTRYDKNCLALCEFYDGQHLSWDMFQRKISETILEKYNLKDICDGCCWLSLCENTHRV